MIRREFEKRENNTSLTAFIFNRMNVFNIKLLQQQQLIIQQQQQIQQLKAQLQQVQNPFQLSGEDIFKI